EASRWNGVELGLELLGVPIVVANRGRTIAQVGVGPHQRLVYPLGVWIGLEKYLGEVDHLGEVSRLSGVIDQHAQQPKIEQLESSAAPLRPGEIKGWEVGPPVQCHRGGGGSQIFRGEIFRLDQ